MEVLFFETNEYIPYDTDVIITYHKKKRISIPFSSRSLHRKNHSNIAKQFSELGFTEIYQRKIEDLKTGLLTKDGSVEKVYIQNADSFKKNTVYDYDEKIIIEYHTFKNKR